MHPFPMWSAALRGDVKRFTVDFEGDDADREAPTCRTNSAVESHFKVVKHQRLEGRSRVRLRAFVMAELTYVLGKLNERKLTKVRNSRDVETSQTPRPLRRRGCHQ